MNIIKKSIQNPPESPYLDWIKSGRKTFEGRLKVKIEEWSLKIGSQIMFFDEKNKESFVIVEVESLPTFSDFGEAFDILGEKLIPGKTKEEVINMYNNLFHFMDPEEILVNGVSSKIIKKYGVVAIGLKIIDSK